MQNTPTHHCLLIEPSTRNDDKFNPHTASGHQQSSNRKTKISSPCHHLQSKPAPWNKKKRENQPQRRHQLLPTWIGSLSSCPLVNVSFPVLPLLQSKQAAYLGLFLWLWVFPSLVNISLCAVYYWLLGPRLNPNAGGGSWNIDVFGFHGLCDTLLNGCKHFVGHKYDAAHREEHNEHYCCRLETLPNRIWVFQSLSTQLLRVGM